MAEKVRRAFKQQGADQAIANPKISGGHQCDRENWPSNKHLLLESICLWTRIKLSPIILKEQVWVSSVGMDLCTSPRGEYLVM